MSSSILDPVDFLPPLRLCFLVLPSIRICFLTSQEKFRSWTSSASHAANGLGVNRVEQFGFCFGPHLVWWEMVALAICLIWFGFRKKIVWFGLVWFLLCWNRSETELRHCDYGSIWRHFTLNNPHAHMHMCAWHRWSPLVDLFEKLLMFLFEIAWSLVWSFCDMRWCGLGWFDLMFVRKKVWCGFGLGYNPLAA